MNESMNPLPQWLSGKEPACNAEKWIRSLGQEDPLEEGMATHSSILACRIPMDQVALWATVFDHQKESDITERLNTPIPVFLPGEFHEQRSLAGYSPWGCKEPGMTEHLTYTQDE